MSAIFSQQLAQAISHVKDGCLFAGDHLTKIANLPEEEHETDLIVTLRGAQVRLKNGIYDLQDALHHWQIYIEKQPAEERPNLEQTLAAFPTNWEEIDTPAYEGDGQWPCFKLLSRGRGFLNRIEAFFLAREDAASQNGSVTTAQEKTPEDIRQKSTIPKPSHPAKNHSDLDTTAATTQHNNDEAKRPTAPNLTPDDFISKLLTKEKGNPFQNCYPPPPLRFTRPAPNTALDDEEEDDFAIRTRHPAMNGSQTTFRQFKLEPPKFDGDPKEWGTFWLTFRRLIHDQPLPNHEKHLCLLQHLTKGSAARQAIDAYPPSDDNYPVVVRILHEEFGDEQALREKLVAELLQLPVAKNNLASLQTARQHIERICLQLQPSKGSSPTQEEIVCGIIRSKLPEATLEMLLDWELQSPKKWSLADLRNGLSRIVTVKKRLEQSVATLRPPPQKEANHQKDGKSDNRHQHTRRDNKQPETVRNFAVVEATTPPPANPPKPSPPPINRNNCSLCDKPGHRPFHCPTYPTANDRKARLKEQKRCFICLRQSHQSNECDNKKPCEYCGKMGHHAMTCYQKERKESSPQPRGGSRQPTPEPANPPARPPPKLTGGNAQPQGTTYTTTHNLVAIQNADSCVPTGEEETAEITQTNNATIVPSMLKHLAEPTSSPQQKKRRVVMMTRTVMAASAQEPSAQTLCPIFLDTGSETNYIARRAVDRLQPKQVGTNRLRVYTFADRKAKEINSPRYAVRLLLYNGTWMDIELNMVEEISGPVPTQIWGPKETKHRWNVPYVYTTNIVPEILLGIRGFWKYIISAQPIPEDPDVFIIQTVFGPVLSGETDFPGKLLDRDTSSLVAIAQSDDEDEASNSSSLPSLPSYTSSSAMSIPSTPSSSFPSIPSFSSHPLYHSIPSILPSSTQYRHFISTLPPPSQSYSMSLISIQINDSVDPLPPTKTVDNFWNLEAIGIREDPAQDDDQVALNIFRNSAKQLANGRYQISWIWREPRLPFGPTWNMAYRYLFSVWKRLSNSPDLLRQYNDYFIDQREKDFLEPSGRDEDEFFLPHLPVITPKKLRIVLHASAKNAKTQSLNDALHPGPVLLPELVGMLLRWRSCRVPVLADVQSAFLAIEIDPNDRKYCKILWLKDHSKPPSADNLTCERYKRMVFGVNCSPFLLAAVLLAHFAKYDSPLARQLEKNTYVDNVLMEAETEEEALQLAKEAKAMFADCQMNLREYITHLPPILEQLPEEDRLGKVIAKVLGLMWNTPLDSIQFTFPQLASDPPTRRTVLSGLASVFDPLGLVGPCVLLAKFFFQHLWDEHHQWDTILSPEKTAKWTELRTGWTEQIIEIPRHILPLPEPEIQLHVFCDASELAYATVLYIRAESSDTTISRLVFSKNRLKPLKASAKFTIPRLELLAILIGTRAKQFFFKEFNRPISATHFWSDSRIALAWVQGGDAKAHFEQCRIREIRQNANGIFHFVRTDQNPADVATRGSNPTNLRQNKLWWEGPNWLVKEPSEWPNELSFEPEAKCFPPLPEEEESIVSIAPNVPDPTEPWIDAAQFSTLTTLIQVTLFVLRFIGRLRPASAWVSVTGFFSTCDYRKAWITLIKMEQKCRLPLQIPHPTFLNQDGILCLKTRLINCEMESMASPIFLPRHSPLTTLIILDIHCQLRHAGTERVLTRFLGQYWMPRARLTIKSTLSRCLLCRRMSTPPFARPDMPPLPSMRVKPARPFEYVGLDFLGPTSTRQNDVHVKTWVLIIACLVTRAIYLEAEKEEENELIQECG